ncbi:MAG: DEAD/DEAH box helicase, partial [Syntrophaceae bacterium]|nr:DEAD/DEAH box helicase [Syntrophaceae bacterium]
MDTLADLFKKMETPISFASHDDYSRLALVKDLEKGMTALAAQLLRRLPASSGVAGQGEALVRRLGELFSGFDGLPLAEKRERIAAAREQLLAIRSLLQPPLPPHRKEDGAAGQDLDQPLQSLPGIGPRLSVLLGRKHLITIRDLLFFLPRRYEDRRRVSRIADTGQGGRHTVVGRIAKAEMRSYGRRRVFEVTVKEGDSLLKAKWFHGREAFFRQIFQPDRRLILTGTVRPSPLDREMLHPEFEVLDEQEDQSLHFRRIVPFYSETEGIPQKRIRRLLWQAVRDYGPLLESPIPDPLCKKRQLIGISKAIKQVHFPEDQEDPLICEARRSAGHRRLIYEELFLFQLGLALVRQERQQEQGIAFRLGGPLLTRFLTGLPFPLTAAQQRVIREIERDMAAPQPMSRLLQGDVGSGKTVVAMAAMVIACENGHQTVLMAPTEILAEQHFCNLKPWAERL